MGKVPASEPIEFELIKLRERETARLQRYTSTFISYLRSVHMVPNLFHNALYLISSTLIVGDLIFSIQNRVQKTQQSRDAVESAFKSALNTYLVKRAGAVAEAIKEIFPDQLPEWEMQWQQLEARLGEFIQARHLALQDVEPFLEKITLSELTLLLKYPHLSQFAVKMS